MLELTGAAGSLVERNDGEGKGTTGRPAADAAVGIAVNEDGGRFLLEVRGQVDGRGGLTDAAFL